MTPDHSRLSGRSVLGMVDSDDWRLHGQEKYLQGITLTWKRYRAPSATWDHDHCAFCWAKFVDAGSIEGGKHVAEVPEVVSLRVTQRQTSTVTVPTTRGYVQSASPTSSIDSSGAWSRKTAEPVTDMAQRCRTRRCRIRPLLEMVATARDHQICI